MISKDFPLNTVVRGMSYVPSTKVLTIVYPKETKRYENVPSDIAHKWYYCANLKDALSYYSTNIRKKFTVIKALKK